jgi:hypothetical protein
MGLVLSYQGEYREMLLQVMLNGIPVCDRDDVGFEAAAAADQLLRQESNPSLRFGHSTAGATAYRIFLAGESLTEPVRLIIDTAVNTAVAGTEQPQAAR